METADSGFMQVGGKKNIATCAYCRRDITQLCRIKCNVCTDVELCIDCFCAGVNVGSHENIHSYKISDCLDFPIFSLDWSAGEELLLLEGNCLYSISICILHELIKNTCIYWCSYR